jgi:branched-chain amino acid transport system permease protein
VTDFLDAVLNGACVGAGYALIGLGFVIIFKSTGVLNFAQGGMMLLGAYFIYQFHITWGLGWYLSMALGVVAGALFGIFLEVVVLRYLIGQPVFAQIMVTVGILFILSQLMETIWGTDSLNMNDPWGLRTVTIHGAVVPVAYVWTFGLAIATFLAFFAFFRFSTFGTAMRATAVDQEAALAQGISASRVYLAAWAIAGGCATLAGVAFTTGSHQLSPQVQFVALFAFPAIILGGLDSPGGALVGGLTIGILQGLAATYVPRWFKFFGAGFDSVVPYILLVVLLLIKPYGLFGTKEVRRV